jgi:hypothetical protein
MSAQSTRVGRACATALLIVLAFAAFADEAAVRIVSPAAGETRHDNQGKLPVQVALSIPYSTMRVLIDGSPHGSLQDSPAFILTGIDRGEHTIQVQALERAGTVIAASEPVTFYMWQASRLFPNHAK